MMDFNMFQEVVKDNILNSLPAEYKEASVSVHAVPKSKSDITCTDGNAAGSQ